MSSISNQPSLVAAIEQLAARLTRRSWAVAIGRVVLVTLAVGLLLIGIDAVVRSSDPGLRWLASLAWIGGIATAVVQVFRYLRHEQHAPLTVAQRLQQHYPKLGSRLASALEFAGQSTDATEGSPELRRAVFIKAESEIESLDVDAIIDNRPTRQLAWAGWTLASIALVTCLLAPASMSRGAYRLVAPWTDAPWPRRHALAFVDLPTQLARGEAFQAVVVDENGMLPEEIKLQIQPNANDPSRVEEQMMRLVGNEATAIRENQLESFYVRAVGGDDQFMDWQRVEVIDPPAIAELQIKVTPPAYTGLPVGNAGSDLQVLEGSTLDFTAEVDSAVDSAAIEIIDGEQLNPLPATLKPLKTGATITGLAAPWTAEIERDAKLNQRFEPPRPRMLRYRIAAAGRLGITGYSPARSLRIDPDTVPTVDWKLPVADVYVTPQAVVSIAVAVEDNLAIKSISLKVRRASSSEATGEPNNVLPAEEDAAETLVLSQGDAEASQPAPKQAEPWPAVTPDRQQAEWTLDLAESQLADWQLQPGDQLLLTSLAKDYRPGTGETPFERRVVIITEEELDNRITQDQTQLLRQLQRALTEQRKAEAGTRDLAIEQKQRAEVDRATTDRLATLGFEQRQAETTIADPQQGAVTQVEKLLKRLEANRVDRPELASQLEQMQQELSQAANRSLPAAARGLADARRRSEQLRQTPNADEQQKLAQGLADTNQQQQQVAESLERMVDSLAGLSDFRRFARDAGELEKRQQELLEATTKQAAQALASRQLSGAQSSGTQQAEREKLAAEQAEISRRFDNLLSAMQQKAAQGSAAANASAKPDASQQTLQDAIAEAKQRATAGKLRDASRQLDRQRLGRATAPQQSAAEDLKELRELLQNRTASDPKQLAEQLKQAKQQLSELRQELNKRPQESAQQRKLAAKAERLSRQLRRLTAQAASESTQQGAGALGKSSEGDQAEQQAGRQEADKQLAKAEQQVEQQIKALEQAIAERVLEQLGGQIDKYVERQRVLLDQTQKRADDPQADGLPQPAEIAVGQSSLRSEIADVVSDLPDRTVFHLTLSGVQQQMLLAEERLDRQDLGVQTQQHEQAALDRLGQVAEALRKKPPKEGQPKPGGQGGQGGGKPKGPPLNVAEIKMLRMLQQDLNLRTPELEAAQAEANLQELADEQRQLAELVQEIMQRSAEDSSKEGEAQTAPN